MLPAFTYLLVVKSCCPLGIEIYVVISPPLIPFFVGCSLKRKGADSQRAGKKAAKNAAKDPNKPKRPSSAFFVFMYGYHLSVRFFS